MTKSTMTRKQALEFAALALEYMNMEGIHPDTLTDVNYLEVVEVLGKMHEQLSKPRAKAVSKARKLNESLAEKVSECFPFDGGLQTTKDVVEMGFPEITTTQKAAAVLHVACEKGWIEKVTVGKKIAYRTTLPYVGEDA